MLGTTLETTPDYLRQLKQSDHNVLYSEVMTYSLLKRLFCKLWFPCIVIVEAKVLRAADCQVRQGVGRSQA